MNRDQDRIPIQPVEQPILCSPYDGTGGTLDIRYL